MSRKYVFNFIVWSEPQRLNNEIYEGKRGCVGEICAFSNDEPHENGLRMW